MYYILNDKEFVSRCKREFRYLVDEFCFDPEAEISSYLPREFWLTMKGTHTAVEIVYFGPQGLLVNLVKLQNGAVRVNGRASVHVPADFIIRARVLDADCKIEKAEAVSKDGDVVMGLVTYYARAIRCYASDILCGNFEFFDEVYARISLS